MYAHLIATAAAAVSSRSFTEATGHVMPVEVEVNFLFSLVSKAKTAQR
jgi:hypothetical protein